MEEKKEFDESIFEEIAEEAREEAPDETLEEFSEDTMPEEVLPDGEIQDQDESEEESGEEDKKSDKKKKKKMKAMETALKKSEDKVAELTDLYQRLMAEFENARKRNAKEQSRMYDIGAKEVLSRLLPVIDNFERGIDALSEEEKEGAFAQGVIKIYQQMMTIFEELGVKAMDAEGKEFNPDLHNAVMHEENPDMGENLVAQEFQKGYMYKDSVLRHSMVKVVN
ncbi:MAG: nucleotide exchange factor GrpE [Eubacterium sp.]|nr:nucleotide exchange factor GrpE [Eubacterium sp.]